MRWCILLALPWASLACGADAGRLAVDARGGRPEVAALHKQSAPPQLGRGTDYSEERTYGKCIIFTRPPDAANAFTDKYYHEAKITSHTQLHEQVGVNATVAAKGLWGSAGGSVNYFHGLDMAASSFYWLADATYETNAEVLDLTVGSGIVLSDEAKSALADGYDAFVSVCGTHFFASRQMGARFSVMYELRDRSQSEIDRLSAEAEYNGPTVSASGGFSRIYEQFKDSHSLLIHSRAIGGDHRIPDKPGPDDIGGVLAALQAQVITEGKGAAISWSVAPYEVFPEVRRARVDGPQRLALKQMRDAALATLFACHTREQDIILRAQGLLDRASRPSPEIGFTPEHLDELHKIVVAARAHTAALEPLARACLYDDAGTCEMEAPTWCSAPLALPSPDFRLGVQAGWILEPSYAPPPDSDVMLMGTSPRGNQAVFDCDGYLTQSFGQARIRSPHDPLETFIIGTFRQVDDVDAGGTLIDLCRAEHSNDCSVQLVHANTNDAALDDRFSHVEISVFGPGASTLFTVQCRRFTS